MKKPRAKIIPSNPNIGDIVEVKTLITHVMETGSRKNRQGKLVPRHIIHGFKALFEGQPVFAADMNPGISANPYLSFRMRVSGPGTLKLIWTEDGGAQAVLEIPVPVA